LRSVGPRAGEAGPLHAGSPGMFREFGGTIPKGERFRSLFRAQWRPSRFSAVRRKERRRSAASVLAGQYIRDRTKRGRRWTQPAAQMKRMVRNWSGSIPRASGARLALRFRSQKSEVRCSQLQP